MADQKKIYRALSEAKRNGLNVGSAFRARFKGPFEAKDKDGNVIPPMLGPDCVNPETMEVTPKYNPDDDGAVLVDSEGKTVCTSTKIAARFLKGLINAKFETPVKPFKLRREQMFGSPMHQPLNLPHSNDFYVIAMHGTVRNGTDTEACTLFLGQFNEATGKHDIVLNPIQAFKLANLTDLHELAMDIEYAIGVKCLPATAVVKFGDLTFTANLSSIEIKPIVCEWRAMDTFAEKTFKSTRKAKPRRPRRKDVETAAPEPPEEPLPDPEPAPDAPDAPSGEVEQ